MKVRIECGVNKTTSSRKIWLSLVLAAPLRFWRTSFQHGAQMLCETRPMTYSSCRRHWWSQRNWFLHLLRCVGLQWILGWFWSRENPTAKPTSLDIALLPSAEFEITLFISITESLHMGITHSCFLSGRIDQSQASHGDITEIAQWRKRFFLC